MLSFERCKGPPALKSMPGVALAAAPFGRAGEVLEGTRRGGVSDTVGYWTVSDVLHSSVYLSTIANVPHTVIHSTECRMLSCCCFRRTEHSLIGWSAHSRTSDRNTRFRLLLRECSVCLFLCLLRVRH